MFRSSMARARVAEFRGLVEGRGQSLRSLTREQLLDLQTTTATEYVIVHGRPASVSVIIEVEPDQAVFVIVQGFMPGKYFTRVSDVALHGFRRHLDGRVTELAAEELYAYD